MEKRTHNFLKGLGILFAVAAGIGTAVLGYVDRTDWIQVAFYSVAVVAIVLWGWHFFLVRWSYQSQAGDTKETEDDESSSKRGLFWDLIARNWIAVTGFLLLLGGLYNIIISNSDLLILGFLTSSINFIFLFFGQRVAKDYDGAAVIVNYFILNMIGLLSISLSIV